MNRFKNQLYWLLFMIQSLIHATRMLLFRAYLLLLFAMRMGGAIVIGAAAGGAFYALARMDIVSVNCPHTPATYHLLNARRLDLLKPEAFIVNTARGEVIDEAALANAIRTGKLAGAGLDVFEREPAVNPDLVGLPNVILLPHMGSATVEGRVEMGEKVIINIKTFADGHRPPDRVIPAIL